MTLYLIIGVLAFSISAMFVALFVTSVVGSRLAERRLNKKINRLVAKTQMAPADLRVPAEAKEPSRTSHAKALMPGSRIGARPAFGNSAAHRLSWWATPKEQFRDELVIDLLRALVAEELLEGESKTSRLAGAGERALQEWPQAFTRKGLGDSAERERPFPLKVVYGGKA